MFLLRFFDFRLSKTQKIREFQKISKKLTLGSLFYLQNGAFSYKIAPQDPPKSVTRPPKIPPRASGVDFGASGGGSWSLWDRFWSLRGGFWSVRDRFGTLRGLILVPFRVDFVQSPEKTQNLKISKNARDSPCFYYNFRRFDFVSVSFCAIARKNAKPQKF